MIPAPIPENDTERVASLERMNFLSTPRESDLDRITRTAKRLFDTDVALVSLVDRDRQWFKSRIGVNVSEMPREISFCSHTIGGASPMVVPNALQDERFHDNPLVTGDLAVRFYAGYPLTNGEGFRIGTLCVVSSTPRDMQPDDIVALEDLGRMTEIIMENRKLGDTQSALLKTLVAAQRDKMIDPLTGLWNRRGLDELFDREIARAKRQKNYLAAALVDIDHFKSINDNFGHAVGDDAIALAASILTDSARATDVVARYGGEEFTVLAGGSKEDAFLGLGEKILQAFRARGRVHNRGKPHCFTASVGIAIAGPRSTKSADPKSLLTLADAALYEAKNGGRDRCVIKKL